MTNQHAAVGERPSLSRARLAAFGCLTTLLVLFLLGAALELGARLILADEFVPGLPMGRPVEATAVFDAELGWRNRPDVRTRIIAPKFSYSVEISSQGLRDEVHTLAKPPGVFRVLFLGDSMTWAWGVEREEGFVHLVDEVLGPDVEAINLAVPGYSNDQELWALEREGLRFQPDLVVLCFILNDVVGNHAVRGHGIAHEKPRYVRDGDGWRIEGRPVPEPKGSFLGLSLGPYRWLYSNSAFLHWIFPEDLEAQIVEERREQIEAEGEADVAFGGAAEEVRRMCDEVAEPGSVTNMLLGRIAERCREAGVPLVAFALPHGHDRFLYAADWYRPKALEKAGVVPGEVFESYFSRKLREAGEALGFRTFSVDDAMLETMKEERVDLHVGDGHLNQLGNRIVAERLVEELAPLIEALHAGRTLPPAPVR